MSERIFHAPNANRGSALEQLIALRDMARRTPAADAAVAAAPVEAFAAGAEAPAAQGADNAAAAAATEYVDNAAAHVGVVGNDPDGLARAAQAAASAGVADPAYASAAGQIVDVTVQPRLIIQGQHGPIIIPIDVPVPAAQPRVTIAAPTAVIVDPATGQAVAHAAGGAAPEAAAIAAGPRQGLRNMSAADFGNIFRRGGTPVAEVAGGTVAPVAPVAAEAGAAVGKPSLLEQLRGAAGGLRGPVAPAGAAGAVEVVADAAPAAAKPSLLDQLRGAVDGVRLPAAAASGAAEVAPAANVAPKGLAAFREGLSGLSALRHAPAREAVTEAIEHAPSLADRALDALKFASKVNPKG